MMSNVPTPPDVPGITNQIAFVIDGEVQEVIYVGDRFNAILTSNPTIVSVPSGTTAQLGYTYSADNGFQAPTTN
jgi:hypothetical protein